MKDMSLKTRLLLSFLAVVAALSLLTAGLGFYVINRDIIGRAQQKVERDLSAARMVYRSEIERIGDLLRIVKTGEVMEEFRTQTGLHYLRAVDAEQAARCESEIVRRVYETGRGMGGTRIISSEEIEMMSPAVRNRTGIPVKDTPKAKKTDRKVLNSAMTKEYALPIYNGAGEVTRILYGGKIVNKDYSLVDRIRSLVFGNQMYEGKPVGTVTIFQDDVRVATNVLNEQGKRAIGTRVSAEVYDKVAGEGQIWHDRAFVVTDWYKTAYEPIRNINDEVIGILYVGILEKPFTDLARNVMFFFLLIVIAVSVLGLLISIFLANVITRPLRDMIGATYKYSDGDFGHNVHTEYQIPELRDLAHSFNEMSARLDEREKSLKESNEKLTESNRNYVELIRFVAHELNGILGSAIMNIYSVRDGFLGMVNFKQRKAIDSVARNLDYLAATVKKFLNLGRIERGELPVNKSKISLKKDVFDISVDALISHAERKNVAIENNVAADLEVFADTDLMKIVSNNLVSNAIKYSYDDGRVIISAAPQNGKVVVEVYNDGDPISAEQKDKLFRKFSRLDNKSTKKEKGNGLGLYITRNIVEAHGGKIWVEPKEKGNSFMFTVERGTEGDDSAGKN